MMSASSMCVRNAFKMSRTTLNLHQSHRVLRTTHCINMTCRSPVTTCAAATYIQPKGTLSTSRPFSSGFVPDNKQSSQPSDVTSVDREEVVPVDREDVVPFDVNMPTEELYDRIGTLHSDVVLDMLQTSYKLLDKIALAISLRRLHQVISILPEQARENYIEHVRTSAGFQVMCALLARNAQHLSADVVFDMTMFLADFGLDSDHPAQQVNLQLCRFHINELALDQLVGLTTTLSGMTATDQTRTLFDGIGALCAARGSDVAILSLEEKISLLQFYADRFSEEYRLQVVRSVKREIVDVDWKSALSLLKSMELMQLSDWTILSRCIDAISRSVDELTTKDVFVALDTCFAHKMYSPDLLHAFGDKLVTQNGDFTEKLLMLEKLRQQSFVHGSLITDVVRLVAGCAETFRSIDSQQLVDLLRCVSEANLWTPGVSVLAESLRQKLTESCQMLQPASLLQACISLAILKQSIPSDVSKLMFHPDNLEQLLTTEEAQPSEHLSAHHITVTEKLFLVASASETSEGIEWYHRLVQEHATETRPGQGSLPLKGAVEMCLCDEPCIVKHDTTSKTGLHIDHLIRCEPTATGGLATLGSTQESAHGKPVAVLVFDGSSFQRNTGQLKGLTHLYCRTLQREGHLVAVVNWNSFLKVEERDRLGYLQHKILFAADYQKLHMLGIDNIGHTE